MLADFDQNPGCDSSNWAVVPKLLWQAMEKRYRKPADGTVQKETRFATLNSCVFVPAYVGNRCVGRWSLDSYRGKVTGPYRDAHGCEGLRPSGEAASIYA